MNILTITEEIKHKLNHLISTKLNSYVNTLGDFSESERESKVSMFITDLTFQLSSKIIKEKISKINPKPLTFTLKINREKYFEQTANELMKQVNEGVYFDPEEISKQKQKFVNQGAFDMEFSGYFLEDNGYIGTKKIIQKDELISTWFPAILSCLKVDNKETEVGNEMLKFVEDFVTFGFNKALDLEYVFIDSNKINETLLSVDYVVFDQKEITVQDFLNIKEKKTFNKK